MIVIGIDPGPDASAFVVWDGVGIIDNAILGNQDMISFVKARNVKIAGYHFAIEGIQNFGKVVGKDVFKTCIMIGRILEAGGIGIDYEKLHIVYRPAIKAFLCGTVRAKDKDIRQALISILGKEVTKGVSSHIWSALAVAVYYYQNFISAANLKKREVS